MVLKKREFNYYQKSSCCVLYQRDTEDADVQDDQGLRQEKGMTRGTDPQLRKLRGFHMWQAYRQLSVPAALSLETSPDLILGYIP